MKALYLDGQPGAASLRFGDIPAPQVRDDEVLVKVHASACMPDEPHWMTTVQTPAGAPRPFPIVLGHGFSGVVASLGAAVAPLAVGDAVYGIIDRHANGAQADYCIASAHALARKPRLIDHVQASVLPIPALAAWHALFALADLQRGQRILIRGSAGAAGLIAVQLARWRGARVAATAPADSQLQLRLLGAETVIDDRSRRLAEIAGDADLVLDCRGGGAAHGSCAALAAASRLVTIAADCASAWDNGARDALARMGTAGSRLTQIGQLVDSGDLRVLVAVVLPLPRARHAYARPSRHRHLGGIAVRVAE
jgi:NADPH:quinone reductase-like Zn-dependent oxidoreductase